MNTFNDKQDMRRIRIMELKRSLRQMHYRADRAERKLMLIARWAKGKGDGLSDVFWHEFKIIMDE